MTKVVVTGAALREALREVLWNKEHSAWSSNAEGPASVSSNVDPSAAVTDPVNPNFKPQDRTEFGVAVGQLVRNMSDSDMPGLYDAVKAAVEDKEDKEGETQMKTNAASGKASKAEEAVRRAIRSIIAEACTDGTLTLNEAGQGDDPPAPPSRKPLPFRLKKGEKPGPVMNLDNLPPVRKIPAGVHGKEYEDRINKNKGWLNRNMGKAIDQYENPKADPNADIDPEAPERAAAAKRRHAYKSTAIGGMSDVNYDVEAGEHKPASFEEIAKGLSLDSAKAEAQKLGIDVTGMSFEDIVKAIIKAQGGNEEADFESVSRELGFSVAGAKQAVDKALAKARWITKIIDPDDPAMVEDMDIIVITAMNDYIKHLAKSGELSAADVQLMKDHPDIVEDLDGFRDFLHNYVKRIGKKGIKGVKIDYLGDNSSAERQAQKPQAGKPAPPAPRQPASAPTPEASPSAAPAPAGGKGYKIYPGGKRYGGKPVVTRVKNRVYGPSSDTAFKAGEQGEVSMDGDKLRVKKPGSDHTQTWDPVEEGKRPVLFLRDPNAGRG